MSYALGQAKLVPGSIHFMTTRTGKILDPGPLIEAGLPLAPYIEHGSWAWGQPAIMRYGLDPYRGLSGLGMTPEQERRSTFLVSCQGVRCLPAKIQGLRAARRHAQKLASKHRTSCTIVLDGCVPIPVETVGEPMSLGQIKRRRGGVPVGYRRRVGVMPRRWRAGIVPPLEKRRRPGAAPVGYPRRVGVMPRRFGKERRLAEPRRIGISEPKAAGSPEKRAMFAYYGYSGLGNYSGPAMGDALVDWACDQATYADSWRARMGQGLSSGAQAALVGGAVAGLLGALIKRPVLGMVVGAVTGWGTHAIWTAPYASSG